MASFSAHIEQAKKNLVFLGEITNSKNYEWQVTVCFYAAVHLINAHLAIKLDQHYRSHGQVDHAINSRNKTSIARLTDELYLAYNKLHNLSKRARYLINENPDNKENNGFFTYSVHLQKSIRNLDTLLKFFHETYKIDFNKIKVNCIDLKGKYESRFFAIV